MHACDLEHIRKILTEKRHRLLQSIKKSLIGTIHSDARMSFELAQDNPDRSVDELLKHINAHMLGNMGDELEAIETVLQKIRSGTYGICESCEQPIAIRRLQAYPESVHCVACQEEIERMPRLESDADMTFPFDSTDTHADEDD